MKASNIFGGLFNSLGKAANLGSHIHTLTDMISTVIGKEPGDKAPPSVKGLYGIFGKADERAFQVLLDKLEKEKPGAREIISGFLRWAFPHDTTTNKLLSFYYGNLFRVFVTKMGSNDGREVGKKVTTSDYTTRKTNAQVKTVTDTKVFARGADNALEFLKVMVATIASGKKFKELKRRDLTRGYKKLYASFQSEGVPCIPKDAEKNIQEVINHVKGSAPAAIEACIVEIESLHNHLETRLHESRRKKRTFPVRFVRALFLLN